MERIIADLETARAESRARCPGEPALMIAEPDICVVDVPGIGKQSFIRFDTLIAAMKGQCLPA